MFGLRRLGLMGAVSRLVLVKTGGSSISYHHNQLFLRVIVQVWKRAGPCVLIFMVAVALTMILQPSPEQAL